MKYIPPLDSADPDAGFVDGNESNGTEGSQVPANAIEHPMREIQNAITAAGIAPNTDDLGQLAKAIKAISIEGFNQNLAPSGFQKLPSGLLLQWGYVPSVQAGGGTLISWPVAFPNRALHGSANHTGAGILSAQCSGVNLNGCTLLHSHPTQVQLTYFVIGY